MIYKLFTNKDKSLLFLMFDTFILLVKETKLVKIL